MRSRAGPGMWGTRYREAGAAGERSDAAPAHRITTRLQRRSSSSVRSAARHMRWGTRKSSNSAAPTHRRKRAAASTIGAILPREGWLGRHEASAAYRPVTRSHWECRRPNVCGGGLRGFPTRRLEANRSADHLRRPQPVSAARAGRGEDRPAECRPF